MNKFKSPNKENNTNSPSNNSLLNTIENHYLKEMINHENIKKKEKCLSNSY